MPKDVSALSDDEQPLQSLSAIVALSDEETLPKTPVKTSASGAACSRTPRRSAAAAARKFMDKGHQIRASMGRLLQMPCRCSDGHCFRQFQTQPTDLMALRKQLLQKDKRDVDEALHRLLQERSPPTLSNAKGRLVLFGMTVCAFAWRRLLGVGSHRYQRLQAAVAITRGQPLWMHDSSRNRAALTRRAPSASKSWSSWRICITQLLSPCPVWLPSKMRGLPHRWSEEKHRASQPAGACGFAAPRVGGRKCSVWTTFEGARS